MATKTIKTTKTIKKSEIRKSKIALYLENPNKQPIITKINDMKAVLR